MQKEKTKATQQAKKYGEPFERIHLLTTEDKRNIATALDIAYITVHQQLTGVRKMKPMVKAAADAAADNRQDIIDRLKGISKK